MNHKDQTFRFLLYLCRERKRVASPKIGWRKAEKKSLEREEERKVSFASVEQSLGYHELREREEKVERENMGGQS